MAAVAVSMSGFIVWVIASTYASLRPHRGRILDFSGPIQTRSRGRTHRSVAVGLRPQSRREWARARPDRPYVAPAVAPPNPHVLGRRRAGRSARDESAHG